MPSAAGTWAVGYTSADHDGEPTRVTGTVALPDGPPPPGGWPVLSWAHGTTGVADPCAPSRDTVDGPAHDYLGLVDETLDEWVADGYAVVRTDFEGLGTPGPHPYLHGDSAANAMVDLVRAARDLDPAVGRDWFAMGHSQGGHAALFAAAREPQRRDVRLRAAVPIAPGGIGVTGTVTFYRDHPDEEAVAAALPFLPILLLGAAAADDRVDPDALLTDEAAPLLTAARTGCMDTVRKAAAGVDPTALFRPDADLSPVTRYFATQEPATVTPRVPTLIAQGTADALAPKPATDRLVDTLCERYPMIDYAVYEGSGHRETVADSLPDVRRFVAALRAGDRPDTHC